MGGVSPLSGLEPVLFRQRVHRLTGYTLFEDTSVQFSNATPQRSTAQVVHYLSALHKEAVGSKDKALPVLRTMLEAAEIPGALEDIRLTLSGITGESGVQSSLFADVRKQVQLSPNPPREGVWLAS